MTTTHYLVREGGSIAYDDMGGTGPAVVLVPGLGDTRRVYRFLGPALRAAGHRVVTMDLRGHGESDPTFTDYSPEAVGGDIVALVEHLDAAPAALVGGSFAAGAVVCAAATSPDAVSAVVTIGGFVRDVPSSLAQRLGLWLLFRRPWGPRAWASFYAGQLYPKAKPADLAEHAASVAANLREPGRLEAMRAMASGSRAGVEALLSAVRAPALVLMGTADPDFPDPVAEARRTAGDLRGRVELFEGGGHFPQAEEPDRTAALILGFLAEVVEPAFLNARTRLAAGTGAQGDRVAL